MTQNPRIIDFDQLDDWSPWLDEIFTAFAPAGFLADLSTIKPEFMEDAREFVIRKFGRDALIDKLNSGLASYGVRFFHGTRVTKDELESIRARGLLPLKVVDRRERLVKIFSKHPEWATKEPLLDPQIHRFGVGWERGGAGKREDDSIHFCISRCGLLYGCNHYLTHGAEVDGHIAQGVFGDDSGLDLLQQHRAAHIVSISAPFEESARAVNPYGVRRPDFPGLLGLLVGAWAYRKSHPNFSVKKQERGDAAKFPAPIGPQRIENIDVVDDEEFE